MAEAVLPHAVPPAGKRRTVDRVFRGALAFNSARTAYWLVSSIAFCLWIVAANGLLAPWIALAVLISVSNTALELFSPRGTDDFTMTVANALVCWAFGAWLY